MDKAEFVTEAPVFYALTIASKMTRSAEAISRNALSKDFFYRNNEDDPDSNSNLLGNKALWDRAIEWLRSRGMIQIRTFPFGSPVYSRAEAFSEQWAS
jgi:hypothetical protein